jgi:CRISPR-associated protein Cmr6
MTETLFLIPDSDQVARLAGWPLPPEAHAGLVWDRYLDIWTGAAENPTVRTPLYGPLLQFVNAFNQRGTGPRNRARDLLRFHHQRLERAMQMWSQGEGKRVFRTLQFRVEWRLAMGLGLDHPTENGFSFDAVIGVPFLPGSSVKGLCRRMSMLSEPNDTVERLFGPTDASVEESGGQETLVFLDAYPRRWPALAVDIINSHHPAYYRDQGPERRSSDGASSSTSSVFPSEIENPVPVFFLTIDGGSDFAFSFGGQESDLDTAEALLTHGLEWLGIGAKTAVGYGTLQLPSIGR